MADALLLPPPLAGDERFQALGQLAARISDMDLSPLLVYLVIRSTPRRYQTWPSSCTSWAKAGSSPATTTNAGAC